MIVSVDDDVGVFVDNVVDGVVVVVFVDRVVGVTAVSVEVCVEFN